MNVGRGDVEYTIAICNYEMANTLRESVNSILSQVDERFEVLVVDDGSRDGSIEILEEFEREHQNFRLFRGENENLAEARNCSFEQANGQYIIESIDVDDRYDPIIQDFVRIFHAIEAAVDEEFYLWGHSINMAPRSLFLEYPYRSLGYGEDKDFWRRLLSENKIIMLDHDAPCESIGYDRGKRDMAKLWFETMTVEFQTGITTSSFIRYNMSQLVRGETMDRKEAAFNLIAWPAAYLNSTRKPQYEPVPGYDTFGSLKEDIRARQRTLTELQAELRFEVDVDELSAAGYDTFVAYEGSQTEKYGRENPTAFN